MKLFTLLVFLFFIQSCNEDSGNSPLPVNDPEAPTNPGSGQDSDSSDDDKTNEEDDTGGVEDPDQGNDDVVVDNCPNANETDPTLSEHNLNVHFSEDLGTYVIDFADVHDQDPKVISLYVTNEGDEVPTFTNGFELTGTAYWMVTVDNPFGTHLNLPISYGTIEEPGTDVSATYGAVEGGVTLSNIPSTTCMMYTIFTFEPEKQPAFRTSTFYLSHKM